MIAAIVAVDANWGIGYNGDLLEYIPEDLKYFKTLTTGNIVIMGRKTWDSLPRKPLPNRLNMVITSQTNPNGCDLINGEWMKLSMDNIKFQLEYNNKEYDKYFIIGGGQIYKELLLFCERVYVTKIYKSHENVDTYFPNLDEMDDWRLSVIGELQTYNGISYSFNQYDRL